MLLVITLNTAAACAILGGIALAMWVLYRGLADAGTPTARRGAATL